MESPYLTLMIFVVGVIGLGIGAELTINCSIKTAWKLGLSPLLIGLTLVSIGTSIPEISIGIAGGLDRLGGLETSSIVVGNWIGSVLNQMTIIIGIVGLFGTLKISKRTTLREGTVLLIALLFFFFTISDGAISKFEGLMLILSYLAYLVYLMLYVRREEKFDTLTLEEEVRGFRICKIEQPTYKDAFLLLAGIAVVALSSDAVIKGGLELSKLMNIDQSVIGFIFVGLGTGIPELIVSLRAIMKADISLSVGNLLGSNMTAILLSTGIGSVIAGFTVDNKIIWYDTPITILAVMFTIIFLRTGEKLDRKESLILILVYLFLAFYVLTT